MGGSLGNGVKPPYTRLAMRGKGRTQKSRPLAGGVFNEVVLD
jgi:hypothetical protein